MADHQVFHVLKEYRPYLRILAAFNAGNFHAKRLRPLIGNIRYAVCVAVMFVSMAALAILSYWHCMENESNVDILSDSLPVIMSLSQMLLTHVSLMLRNRLIHATVEHLQGIVDEREFFFGFFLLCCHKKSGLLFAKEVNKKNGCQFAFIAGMKRSSESSAIYHRIEATHSRITALSFRMLVLAGAVFYAIPVILPISYACFSHPVPEKWILPLDIQ